RTSLPGHFFIIFIIMGSFFKCNSDKTCDSKKCRVIHISLITYRPSENYSESLYILLMYAKSLNGMYRTYSLTFSAIFTFIVIYRCMEILYCNGAEGAFLLAFHTANAARLAHLSGFRALIFIYTAHMLAKLGRRHSDHLFGAGFC